MGIGLDSSSLLWVLLGSALGGAVRYALSEAVAWALKERFPWGTLLVNVSGAFAIGIWLGTAAVQASAHALIALAFLGSYTTVSTFALQSLLLSREGRRPAAAVYVLTSALACLFAVALGFVSGEVVGGLLGEVQGEVQGDFLAAETQP